ncbi:MAG: ATP:cob(I)alamin adenosyltransferase [Myxococcales bacterium]|nr:ATP:cob(I)alamin adenosyltransferase [Myxococcales bacterium]|tara:strand:+ start:3006 stop:3593 length:588 start_codon:yes stop_codon:yes gene_type:complete
MTKDNKVVVKLDQLVTRGGDAGDTSLIGGIRVPKDHLRIETYGTVDELNALLGLCLECPGAPAGAWQGQLRLIQQRLFDLGAELADGRPGAGGSLEMADVEQLESWIEEALSPLEPLTSFLLPGGSYVNAHLHQARTVCRRAERLTVALGREEALRTLPVIYLNRLSDFLFAVSRWVLHATGDTAQLWSPRRRGD